MQKGLKMGMLIAAGVMPLAMWGCPVPPNNVTLTIETTGLGTVDSSPTGTEHALGTVVTLTAAPRTGWLFDHWEGALTGNTNPKTLTLDADKSVTAIFVVAKLVRSTFDVDDEGWLIWGDAQEGTATPTYMSLGGNPGGFVQAVDNATGGVWFWRAPAKFHGDFSSAYGRRLSYELRQSSVEGQFDKVDVRVIGSSGKSIILQGLPHPGTTWTAYAVKLDVSAGWELSEYGPSATAADIQEVLGNITALFIRGEFAVGDDTGGLDNVVLNAD